MASANTPAKKFKSNWFRVAVEGATTDGREIERQWLIDAAETFSQNTYGARIWLEHMRSLYADSPAKAYGDVLALKTEEIEIAGQNKVALFAQIEPTPELVAMNKARQKIYTSIEIDPKFSDTGRAYLTGLAITDSPASIGTEMLKFSALHPDDSPLKSRKLNPNCLFTAAEETRLEFEEVEVQEGPAVGLLSKISALLGKSNGLANSQFSEVAQSLEQLAKNSADQETALNAEKSAREALAHKHAQLERQFKDLVTKLGNTADHSQQQRPTATGGTTGEIETEY